jgi:nucleoside-diphosphate-sugar epimerase
VGSGTPHSIEHVLTTLLSLARAPIEVRVDRERFRPIDVPLAYADTTLLRDHTGWAPQHTLEDGLRATLESYRKDN